MKLFRHPSLKSLTDFLFVLLLVTLAARSEASCAPVVPVTTSQIESMKNCPDSDANLVDGQSSTPDHQRHGKQISLCHLGCPIMLSIDAGRDVQPRYLLDTYVRERQPPMIGISNVPQTPPPRSG